MDGDGMRQGPVEGAKTPLDVEALERDRDASDARGTDETDAASHVPASEAPVGGDAHGDQERVVDRGLTRLPPG